MRGSLPYSMTPSAVTSSSKRFLREARTRAATSAGVCLPCGLQAVETGISDRRGKPVMEELGPRGVVPNVHLEDVEEAFLASSNSPLLMGVIFLVPNNAGCLKHGNGLAAADESKRAVDLLP